MPLPIEYDLLPGTASSEPANFLDVNGTVYFTALTTQYRRELWKINPTTGFPVRITNIGADANNRVSSVSSLINVNGTLYFRGQSGSQTDLPQTIQLYRIDQNTGNAIVVVNPFPGNGSSSILDVNNLTNVNGILYFTTATNKLWRIYPNTAEFLPLLLFEIFGSRSNTDRISDLVNIDGILYFTVGSSNPNDTNQWGVAESWDESIGELPVIW
jgi:ELWxxDGT repeat protein